LSNNKCLKDEVVHEISMELHFYLSFIPLIVILTLLYFRVPLFISGISTLGITLILAFLFWHITPSLATSSLLKGVLVGIDIAIIVAGALLFIAYAKDTGRIQILQNTLSTISDDARIQVLILAWFFVAFLEGTAGFGTPAAVVVPLLIALGIKPLYAVAMALVGDSTAVVFGAIGTPINVGLAQLGTPDVIVLAGIFNGILAIIPPIAILILYELSHEKRNFLRIRECLPHAVWAGLAFGIPFALLSFTGLEFPSVLGSLIGLGLFILTTKLGFVPKSMGKHKRERISVTLSHIFFALSPYIVFVGLLLLTKIFVIKPYVLKLGNGITHNLSLTNPGIIFLVALILVACIHWTRPKISTVSTELKKLTKPFIAIMSITAFVFVMRYTTTESLKSMIGYIALVLSNDAFLFLSPLVGVVGAFFSGSATVSTIMFGALQAEVATSLGIAISLALVLQVTGGAIGNMIALTNIIAANSVAGLVDAEKDVIKLTLIPCLVYTLCAVALAYAFILFGFV
jgi:lactate permease